MAGGLLGGPAHFRIRRRFCFGQFRPTGRIETDHIGVGALQPAKGASEISSAPWAQSFWPQGLPVNRAMRSLPSGERCVMMWKVGVK